MTNVDIPQATVLCTSQLLLYLVNSGVFLTTFVILYCLYITHSFTHIIQWACMTATRKCILADRSSQDPREPATGPLPPWTASPSLQCHRQSHLDGLFHCCAVLSARGGSWGTTGERRKGGNMCDRRGEEGEKSFNLQVTYCASVCVSTFENLRSVILTCICSQI